MRGWDITHGFNPYRYACFFVFSSFVLTEYNKWKVRDAAYMHFAVTAQNTVNRTRMKTYNLCALGCFIQVLMVEATFQWTEIAFAWLLNLS